MKAVILAAGYARRLPKHVRSTPKPLLPIAGRPIIELTLGKLLDQPQVDEVIIVTNDLHHETFKRWHSQYGVQGKVKVLSDGTATNDERLGALGDLALVIRERAIRDDLLVVAGDNYFEFELAEFIKEFHSCSGSIVALRDLGDPAMVANRFGVATIDHESNRIMTFEEKPANPSSALASTLCYILSAEILDDLTEYVDTCRQNSELPDNTGKFLAHVNQTGNNLFGFVFKERWVDIGDYDDYRALNQTELKRRLESDDGFSQSIDAMILFADIISSATISEYSTEEAYDDFITEFQSEALRVVRRCLADDKYGFDEEDASFCEYSVRGDELVLLLYTKRPERDSNFVLNVAIELKRAVFLSSFNRSRQGRSFFDVGIGIHCGRVVLKKHPSAEGANRVFNAEGYSINLTKRLEGYSRNGTFSKIMLSKRFAEIVTTPHTLSSRVDVSLPGIYGACPVYELQVCGNIDEPEFEQRIDPRDIDYYVAALENSGYDVWLSLMVARYYYDEEDYPTAQKYYEAAIERFPKFAVGYRYLGRNFYRQNKYLEARQALEVACGLESLSSKAHNFLAVTLRRLKEWDSAIQHHEAATKYEPNSPYEYNSFAYTIAEAWRSRGTSAEYGLSKANQKLARAEELFGSRAEAYAYILEHTRGMIHLAGRAYDEAIACFGRGIASVEAHRDMKPRKREEKRLELLYHSGIAHFSSGRNNWGPALSALQLSVISPEITAGERLAYYWFRDAEDKIREIMNP